MGAFSESVMSEHFQEVCRASQVSQTNFTIETFLSLLSLETSIPSKINYDLQLLIIIPPISVSRPYTFQTLCQKCISPSWLPCVLVFIGIYQVKAQFKHQSFLKLSPGSLAASNSSQRTLNLHSFQYLPLPTFYYSYFSSILFNPYNPFENTIWVLFIFLFF